MPDFNELALTAIKIFHPEILGQPQHIVEKSIAAKADSLRATYDEILAERRNIG